MLVFDPIRAVSHDFPRDFAIPPKVYKKSETVARLVRGEELIKIGGEQHQNKEIDKLEARRGGTLTGKQLQLSNIYSIDVSYDIVMVLKLHINKEL